MRNKNIYTVVGLLLILVALIFVRERKGNYYTLTVEEVHQISLNNSLFIQPEDIKSDNNSLIITILDKAEVESQFESHMQIYLSELMQPDIRKKIKKHSGKILLTSDNEILMVNAWYVLSRKGFENIKMVGNPEEKLLYKFQPDTPAGLK